MWKQQWVPGSGWLTVAVLSFDKHGNEPAQHDLAFAAGRASQRRTMMKVFAKTAKLLAKHAIGWS
jgi:hypothetical protein